MAGMRIGELSRRSGAAVDTIRFYEKAGLLAAPQRTASGYREYDEAVEERLRYIQRAKELGFTLREIRELLELAFDPATEPAMLRLRAERKLADIAAKIRGLQAMQQSLERLTRQCRNHGGPGACPLLPARDEPRS